MSTNESRHASRASKVPGHDARSTVVGELAPDDQRAWLALARGVARWSPLVAPTTRSGQPMKVRITSAGRFGLVMDRRGYRYEACDQTGEPWPAIPVQWSMLYEEHTGLKPDTALINWYSPDASLGWHRDETEADASLPIVTVSLGDSCQWAVRATSFSPVTRCTLESGAITMLEGPTRRFLHSVERVQPNPMFSPMSERGRVSITLRIAGSHDA